ncbi:ABC transporter ATP-binding protein [Rothia nasimurium]|uniref:ABC transporter ATP-binding protein n=1 Tax=Rothia nasimurium TaxID=85336 RepID=A0A4Y9F229_9MICC|nr:ABC transporter ATP-binding protein [Rothia nasimurium]MBF0808760.1 ABC transporter ATP-binding protein [Rothia nasimurium]TFU21389.1 ABC transporter ATP-binding protein [Rothia nasimurium]
MSTSHTIPIAVSARNLSKTYAGESPVHALRNISIDFERGKFTAIMGPSGSGKSTLLHTLATLDAPDSGEQTSVQVKGVELTGLKDAALAEFRARNIGFIFQAFNLIPTLTAAQNMELPLGLAKMAVDTIWRDELVRTLSLEDRLKHLPSQLSGGQQQRVAIARALLPRPAVIFADEPTGALDSATSTEVLGLLQQASREQGQTILMVTHDPLAASYADRVLLLKDGQLAGGLEAPTQTSVLSALARLGD